jgi:hypothetical protein
MRNRESNRRRNKKVRSKRRKKQEEIEENTTRPEVRVVNKLNLLRPQDRAQLNFCRFP